MIPFELTAIDLILVIAVIVLLILYITKFETKTPKKTQLTQQTITKKLNILKKQESNIQNKQTQCPRGFGNIKKLGDNTTIPERCLGCYKIMECYSEKDCKYEL
ncbi:MAG: hypothetical protein NWF06_05435 [Candidatus Bathyarchaeota archaeon]|nr:hypothetical protein [Candidatus Bathyarchaeum sp.]